VQPKRCFLSPPGTVLIPSHYMILLEYFGTSPDEWLAHKRSRCAAGSDNAVVAQELTSSAPALPARKLAYLARIGVTTSGNDRLGTRVRGLSWVAGRVGDATDQGTRV
jgi:hypothetical protein